MKHVMIVDDEIISRLGLKAIIDWEEYGYEIVAEAENGKEALEILKKQKVDVIFTDIKMPVMNGIELIKNVKENHYDIEYVVLSSYDDFEFVREALKLGAQDYILKLDLNKESMIKTLQQMNEDFDNKPKFERQDNISDNNEKALKNLILGKQNYAEVENINFLSNNKRYYKVINIDINMIEAEEQKTIVYSLIQDIAKGYSKFTLIKMNENILSVVCECEEINNIEIENFVKRIPLVIKDFLDTNVYIIISNTIDDKNNLPSLYLQNIQVEYIRNLKDNNYIVFYNDVIKNYENHHLNNEFDNYVKKLRKAQNENDMDTAKLLINEINTYINTIDYINIREIKQIKNSVISILDWMVWKSTGKLLKEYKPEINIYDDHMLLIDEMYKFMEEILSIILEITSLEDKNYLVRKLKKYIKEHFNEKIQISEIAKDLYVSSSYLSTLFKKETGITIKDYILDIKMDTAKRMLKEGNLQIQEISRFIGCENEHYFSALFKQKVGISPTDFRNK